jgi:endonuclease/exonuclease/phosphatase family metal-dependent hydrolase
MKATLVLVVIGLFFFVSLAGTDGKVVQQPLKVITVNVWSGSDYQGLASFGKWQSDEVREQRYQNLVQELKAKDPDVVFLQEVTPARAYSRRIAKDLNMDQIHQVCIGGIKLFGLGIPWGFQEGNAILAKKGLNLSKIDDWKLSGGPGIFSDNLTFHLDQTITALAGQIVYDGKPVNLVCVHLVATPENKPKVEAGLETIRQKDSLSVAKYWMLRDMWHNGMIRRDSEAKVLLKKIATLDPATPLILGGDFNATSGTEEMRRITELGGFTDTAWNSPAYITWDGVNNSNTFYSQGDTDARGNRNTPAEDASNVVDRIPRKIDYVLLNKAFTPSDAIANQSILTEPVGGLYTSDHYGVEADISLDKALENAPGLFDRIPSSKSISFTVLPIVMYDTDTGVGYGGKGFIRNVFRANESFDLLVFNSTKSERWYKLEISLPDKEIRQRKKFPLAADVKLEYDLMKESRFFGIGPNSSLDDVETYTKLPIEASLLFTHPFNRYLNTQLGLRYKYCSFTKNVEDSPLLQAAIDEFGAERGYLNAFASVRWDSRDSVVNPARGFCLQEDVEMFNHFPFLPGIEAKAGTESFFRTTSTASWYTQLWYPKTVLALRATGSYQNDPVGYVHSLVSLGGGWTLRGAPLDRYLGNTAVNANAEIRFPIISSFGGIVGFDIGQVANSPKDLKTANWAYNPVAGLRLALSNFVVRLDFGFGKDYTGLYFNFGHIY